MLRAAGFGQCFADYAAIPAAHPLTIPMKRPVKVLVALEKIDRFRHNQNQYNMFRQRSGPSGGRHCDL